MWANFEMPDGRGNALAVLDRAARRGVDVRALFWRPDDETAGLRRNAFWGSDAHFAELAAADIHVRIRWDRAHPGYCQHQKSWLIDPGADAGAAFVGGINLNPHSMASPGHDGEGQNHDVYVELQGPSVVDVHHNFVQRWNEASERGMAAGSWGPGSDGDLMFPSKIPARRGGARVQIQRTTHAGRYWNGQASPGGPSFPIGSGERTNFEQYRAAIRAARSAIYIENQYIEVVEIVEELHRALVRGVAVVWLAPAISDISTNAYQTPERRAFFEARASLGLRNGFTLAGIAGLGEDGRRNAVHVHSKLMLVDDEWGTGGSCNLHRYSLFGNGEMNVAFTDPDAVRACRVALFDEHLGQNTAGLDARAALDLFRLTAQQNRRLFDVGDPNWTGLAFTLDIARYGRNARSDWTVDP